MAEAITVVPYDPGWEAAFEAERGRVEAALGAASAAVEHIGSTAVPGLAAKPIIDLMAGLRPASALDSGGRRLERRGHVGNTGTVDLAEALGDLGRCVAPLLGLGYERTPEGDFPGRVFLRRLGADGAATHHLSLTEHDGAYWRDQLAFRDALRRDPRLRGRYAELKATLARESASRLEYTQGKTELVREALAAAGHVPRSGWASEDPGRPGA